MNQEALHKITYGIYILSTEFEGKPNGQIVNSVFQVTAEPATVAVSLNKQNLTCEYLLKTKKFSLSMLEKNTPMPFIGQFGFKSGRAINKFEGVNSKKGITGMPIVLDHTLACLEAEVISQLEVGTHIIIVGKILEAEVLSQLEPMTYAYYHDVKKGFSPKNAPTYIKAEDMTNKKEEKTMDKYVCKVCGYVYDPANGDPDNGVAAGTKFEDIPDTWVCPICGVGKDQFEKQ